MQLDQFVLDALDRVLSWDLGDDMFPAAVSAEAGHLAGLDTEQLDQAELH